MNQEVRRKEDAMGMKTWMTAMAGRVQNIGVKKKRQSSSIGSWALTKTITGTHFVLPKIQLCVMYLLFPLTLHYLKLIKVDSALPKCSITRRHTKPSRDATNEILTYFDKYMLSKHSVIAWVPLLREPMATEFVNTRSDWLTLAKMAVTWGASTHGPSTTGIEQVGMIYFTRGSQVLSALPYL